MTFLVRYWLAYALEWASWRLSLVAQRLDEAATDDQANREYDALVRRERQRESKEEEAGA